MAITKLNTRLMQKYDTEENWGKATGFIPLKGEKIIYAPDNVHPYIREKTGDGVTTVTALPFDENYKGDTIASNIGSTQYIKLCTVSSLVANSDLFIEFDMAGRTFERYQKVKFIARRGQASNFSTCAIFVSGGKGNSYQVRAYQYRTGAVANDYIELWCTLPSYDTLNILKKSFASNYNKIDEKFVWNYEVANAWPTESETVIKVNAAMEEWTGKVDPDIVTMKNYTKPNSTGAITSADTLNSAVGKLEKALDNKAESELVDNIVTNYATKTEVDNTYLKKTDAVQTYATRTSVSSTYLTKTDASNTYAVKDEEFISVEDIDEICGTTIQVATLSEVTF